MVTRPDATEADPRLDHAKRKFIGTLREIFQFDHADLDFGIYRVLNLRRAALDRFLEEDLTPQVETLLKEGGSLTRDALTRERGEIEESLFNLGVHDFATVPRWVAVKAKLDAMPDSTTLAREVFNDLTVFFSRYYEDGDFMALPRYNADTYAIPYDGAEVKLHWANADQYYIKSTEVFGDYRAKLAGLPGEAPRILAFRLVAAEPDRDNNKSTDKRRFVLREDTPFTLDGTTLTCWLEWKAVTKASGKGVAKQDDLNADAAARILGDPALPTDWKLALERKAIQDQKKPATDQRSALHFQLYRYTQKQSTDYFIHKDLGRFLRRELDFFIKNEVLLLDDVEKMDEAAFAVPLRKVRAIRAVALKIITWLAQLEEFQKKLWLKKKFVLKTDLILSQPSLRGEVSPAVRANGLDNAMCTAFGDDDLAGIQPTVETVMDGARPAVYATRDGEFATAWLTSLDAVDDNVTGLLVCSTNSQGLRLIERTYRGALGGAYIDPPYNTGNDGFLYKDTFQHSSWLTSVLGPVEICLRMLNPAGTLFASIDDVEVSRLRLALDGISALTPIACLVWKSRQFIDSRATTRVSLDHEYVLAYGRGSSAQLRGAAKDLTKYTNPDGDERGPWMSRSILGLATADQRPNLHYRLFDAEGRKFDPPAHTGWRYSPETMSKKKEDGVILFPKDESGRPREKVFLKNLQDEFTGFASVIDGVHTADGSAEIRDLFGFQAFFFPKPTSLIAKLVEQLPGSGPAMDFFAGSGTTGHAVINLNREDGGDRKFVLVESGDHFETVLVPRILKATYASAWKDGRPVTIDPVKALYKIITLESYDDTLENLALEAPDDATQRVLDLNPQAREDYVLRYMLDLESEGSLLDLTRFDRPWHYEIKVRKGGEVTRSPVDLVETFNYLLGLHVKSYDTFGEPGLLFVQGVIRAPEGATRGDDKVLVIWRDHTICSEEALTKNVRRFFGRVSDDAKPLPLSDFSRIYLNGDHPLDNTVAAGEARILPIEETFHRLMFDTTDEV